jgi:hypothetical protein
MSFLAIGGAANILGCAGYKLPASNLPVDSLHELRPQITLYDSRPIAPVQWQLIICVFNLK